MDTQHQDQWWAQQLLLRPVNAYIHHNLQCGHYVTLSFFKSFPFYGPKVLKDNGVKPNNTTTVSFEIRAQLAADSFMRGWVDWAPRVGCEFVFTSWIMRISRGNST